MNNKFLQILLGTALLFSSVQMVATAQQVKKTLGESTQVLMPGKITRKGLFGVSLTNGHYYLSIPDSMLGREMLVVTRLAKTPNGISVSSEQYGGEKENEQVWKWEKRNNQLFLRVPNYNVRVNRGADMQQSVENSNFETILYAFNILKRESGDEEVIDVTDFFGGECPAINISEELKKAYKVSSLDNSRSYIDTIKSFPQNVECRTVKTYKSGDSPTDKSNGSITFELNTSILLLPLNPWKMRIVDERVHLWSFEPTDFSADPQFAKKVAYAHRWKLEPKDTAAYLRGELVEPKKPIVFYIDPATPPKWVPYLIAGVNDWQKAFEAAGFKNAIIGKVAPTPQEDPEFSTEDARYSVIRYFASETANAYGPHIADPRSGEIMESHIGWYANETKSLYDWYVIQTAAANPKARKPRLSDEEMGELIRYTSSHEVGHALGLPHNWGSNYAYPVDSLRSKTFTQTHGTAASVMDYSRFNYVAQPGDGITQFSPKIGEYDLWSIKWGYTWFPGNQTPVEERKKLDRWTAERVGDKRYFFGREFTGYDPRTQMEDVGDDAMKASGYGIDNLKRTLPNLMVWTMKPGDSMDNLRYMYNLVLDQYDRYLGHVITNVGGLYVNFKVYGDTVTAFRYVPMAVQRQAVNFVCDALLDSPTWLVNRSELAEFDNGLVIERIKKINADAIGSLLKTSHLARMLDNEIKNGSKAYTVDAMLSDIEFKLFTQRHTNKFLESLQLAYIDLLSKLLNDDFRYTGTRTLDERADNGGTPLNVPGSPIRAVVRKHLSLQLANLSKNNMIPVIQKAELMSRINVAMHKQFNNTDH
jgi:hypothetical protein